MYSKFELEKFSKTTECKDIQNCIYGKSKHKRKEFHIQIVLKFGNCFILQRLMASGKRLTSAGTESRVRASISLLCHDVLVTRD